MPSLAFRNLRQFSERQRRRSLQYEPTIYFSYLQMEPNSVTITGNGCYLVALRLTTGENFSWIFWTDRKLPRRLLNSA